MSGSQGYTQARESSPWLWFPHREGMLGYLEHSLRLSAFAEFHSGRRNSASSISRCWKSRLHLRTLRYSIRKKLRFTVSQTDIGGKNRHCRSHMRVPGREICEDACCCDRIICSTSISRAFSAKVPETRPLA